MIQSRTFLLGAGLLLATAWGHTASGQSVPAHVKVTPGADAPSRRPSRASLPHDAARPAPLQGERGMIEFHLSLHQGGRLGHAVHNVTEFTTLDAILMRLRFVNTGTAAVQLPDPNDNSSAQPTYTLTGPAYPQGRTFSFYSIAHRGQSAPSDSAAKFLTVSPGKSWEGDISLNFQFADISKPGEYHLRANLDWKGIHAETPALTFHIRQARTQGFKRSAAPNLSSFPTTGLAFWEDTENSSATRRVFVGRCRESTITADDGSRREGMKLSALSAWAATGAQATDLVLPALNFDYEESDTNWVCWREGHTLHGLGPAPEAVTFAVEEEPTFLGQPMQTQEGELEVPVVAQNGGMLRLVRFTDKFLTPTQLEAPHSLWTMSLPAKPESGLSAALAPESFASRRCLAFAALHAGGGLNIFYATYARNSKPQMFHSTHIDVGTLVPQSLPALFVNSKGEGRVGVLVETNPAQRACALVEITFDPGGHPSGTPKVTPLGDLPAVPTSGCLLYVSKQNRLFRTDIGLVTQEGSLSVWSSKAPSLRAATLGTLALPLQLLPGRLISYALCLDAEQRPYCQSLY